MQRYLVVSSHKSIFLHLPASSLHMGVLCRWSWQVRPGGKQHCVELHVCPSRCCWRSTSWVRLKLSKRLEWLSCREVQVPGEKCKNEMIWLTSQGQGGRSRSSEPDSEQRGALAVGSDGWFFSQPLAGFDTPMYSEHFLATL